MIAVDLAKAVFEIGLSLQPGKVSRRLRVTREKFLSTMAQLPRDTVIMEACGSAHYRACHLSANEASDLKRPNHGRTTCSIAWMRSSWPPTYKIAALRQLHLPVGSHTGSLRARGLATRPKGTDVLAGIQEGVRSTT